MTDDITAIERRLRELETKSSIVDVLTRYCHCLDYGDEAGLVDCFTEAAVWHAENRFTSAPMRHDGREALRTFAQGHTRPPELFHKHLLADVIVEVDDAKATARSYIVLLVAGPGGLPNVVSFGRYVDDVVQCADGKWRIRDRRVEVEAWSPMWAELRDVRRRSMQHGH